MCWSPEVGDTSKTISDDFSDDGSPLSPREIPAGGNELPNNSKAAVYDPTSDRNRKFRPTAAASIVGCSISAAEGT